MPLVAEVQGRSVCAPLTSDAEWAGIRSLPHSAITLHPCGEQGYPRVSTLGTRHFVHVSGCARHAPESAEHLLLKAVVADAVQMAGWSVAVERPGPGWVADVLATRGQHRVAFEVQRSAQPAVEYRRRQVAYGRDGVRCAWLARSVPAELMLEPELPLFRVVEWSAAPRAVVAGREVGVGELVLALLAGRCQWRRALDAQPVEAGLWAVTAVCQWCGRLTRQVKCVHVRGRCCCGLPVLAPAPPGLADRWEGRRSATCRGCRRADALQPISAQLSSQRVPGVKLAAPHWCLIGPGPRPG